jgi:2-polyprenyl-3-methyl-5-hydroxy-6-metoxy-1,4-benzoquinol methylase
MTNPNQHFIDGTWYEEQYKGGLYHDTYINPSNDKFQEYAKETNRLFARLITAYLDLPIGAKVLDLGSGIGMYMDTWEALGYNVHGIEISQTACAYANKSNLINGSVADLSMFHDKAFDLVFSSAFFEHVDESILPQVMSECARVGIKQAHLISSEMGADISHINLKSMEQWAYLFAQATNELCTLIPDTLLNEYPILVTYPERTDVPYPVAKFLLDQGLWK